MKPRALAMMKKTKPKDTHLSPTYDVEWKKNVKHATGKRENKYETSSFALIVNAIQSRVLGACASYSKWLPQIH